MCDSDKSLLERRKARWDVGVERSRDGPVRTDGGKDGRCTVKNGGSLPWPDPRTLLSETGAQLAADTFPHALGVAHFVEVVAGPAEGHYVSDWQERDDMLHLEAGGRRRGHRRPLGGLVPWSSSLSTHQLWGEQLNRNSGPTSLLLLTPRLGATGRAAPLYLPREKGATWGFRRFTHFFLSSTPLCSSVPSSPQVHMTFHPPSRCPSLAWPPSHPDPLLPSTQPNECGQLASPHHPDCPLPVPALISLGPWAPCSQLPWPRPCCFSHTMSPAWAWGTFRAPLHPRPLPHGVWDRQTSL